MKNKIICILLLFISYKSPSQINHVDVLVGKTELQVVNYFDSLQNLKGNSNKIIRNVSPYGGLVLSTDFSLADEAFYKCTKIIASFQKGDGIEVCIRQGIAGSTKFAESNLAFIKDNFKLVGEGRWEKHYNNLPNIKIKVSFQKLETDKGATCLIIYQLTDQ